MDKEIEQKLQEYINLMDFNNEYFKKDYKNNVKFIKWAVCKMIKNKDKKDEIIKFLQMAIKTHKNNYPNKKIDRKYNIVLGGDNNEI